MPIALFSQNCRFDQCHGKTRAGNRCKSCVSNSGDWYCHQHKYQGGPTGHEMIDLDTYEIPETRDDCHFGQCNATAKSTGRRCRTCVSIYGDTYCWHHNK